MIIAAPKPIADSIKRSARTFLAAMQAADYETIWNELITLEANRLLSIMGFPIIAFREDKVDKLLELSAEELLAYAFQMDLEGIRSGLLGGLATGFERAGWYDFSDEDANVWAAGSAAVLEVETPGVRLIIPFIQEKDGNYKVDLEALITFSMVINASMFYQIGARALELGLHKSAIIYFEFSASLIQPYERLRELVWDNLVVGHNIADPRKRELQDQYNYALLAQDQVRELVSKPKAASSPVNMGAFLVKTFRGYADIPNVEITDKEIEQLQEFSDNFLRKAIASILEGVDPVVARREAEKPHTSVEISDMELAIEVDGELYYLCMPFKSGREIKKSVPIDVSHQIIRPLITLPKSIVVFITAKPCSQNLHNHIKQFRNNLGYAIEVIEYKELGKLLKINGFLNLE